MTAITIRCCEDIYIAALLNFKPFAQCVNGHGEIPYGNICLSYPGEGTLQFLLIHRRDGDDTELPAGEVSDRTGRKEQV